MGKVVASVDMSTTVDSLSEILDGYLELQPLP